MIYGHRLSVCLPNPLSSPKFPACATQVILLAALESGLVETFVAFLRQMQRDNNPDRVLRACFYKVGLRAARTGEHRQCPFKPDGLGLLVVPRTLPRRSRTPRVHYAPSVHQMYAVRGIGHYVTAAPRSPQLGQRR